MISFSSEKSKRKKEESSSQFLKEDSDEESQLEESHGRRQRKSGKTDGDLSSSNENLANANLERARAGEPFLSPLRVNQGLLSGPLVASRDTDTNSRSSKETEQAEDSQGSEGSKVLEHSGGKTKEKKSKTLRRADKTSTEANKTAKAAREVAKAAQNSDEEDVAPAANLDTGEDS